MKLPLSVDFCLKFAHFCFSHQILVRIDQLKNQKMIRSFPRSWMAFLWVTKTFKSAFLSVGDGMKFPI